MSSRRWLLHLFTASALAFLSVACSDKSPVAPDSLGEVPPAELVVSDPFLDSQPLTVAQAVSGRSSLVSAAGDEVAYVSLPAGSLPTAISVTIRNLTIGAAQTPSIPFLDGGFDPIPVVARAGDELELKITAAASATILYRVAVPKRRPPGVVRTSPPQGMIDVALNSRVMVVFTEPVAPATLTTATVQLLQGTVPVPGTLRPVTGSLFAVEFIPDEELASGTTYRLVVTRGVLDADGDSLEAEVATDFTTQTTVPVAAFTSIVAGGGHTCALRADGQVLCWGANWVGQLGAGSQVRAFGSNCPWENIPIGYNPFPCRNVPVAVVGGHTFTSLASGSDHACALTAAGEAFCWGTDHFAELGTDDPPVYCNPDNPGSPFVQWECSGVPLKVGGNLRFGSVVAGSLHTCGIRIGGAAYCWGLGSIGALGIGDAGITASPAAVLGGMTFRSLTSGDVHTCGLTSSGAAYCWGLDAEGQLGNGGASPDICIEEYLSHDAGTSSFPCAKAPVQVSGGLTFASLTAGVGHTCGLTPSGRAYCWGSYNNAVSYGAVPAPVNDNLSFVSLNSGPMSHHTCGVTSANVAYCWGHNLSGQLGDGSMTSTLVPVRVAGDLAFVAVAAGGAHSCGITTAGTLYCWGANWAGQLGAGNAFSAGSLRPVRVSGPR